MEKINLHDKFIESLREKIPNKKQLVNTIVNILRIEKEPAYRRLNGKVQFSVQEMGILADELGILLDSLLLPNRKYQWVPFLLESPNGVKSLDTMCDMSEMTLDHILHVTQETANYGCVFHVLPIELYIYHPHLMKFMFFRWGHFFVGTDEFNDFSNWKLSDKTNNLKEKIEKISAKISHTLYIWDDSLIWTLVKEINYLHKMHIINEEDKKNLRNELKEMLTLLEKYLKGNYLPQFHSNSIDFYVSHINVGITSNYFFSKTKQLSYFQTSFSFSHADSSYENFINVKKWIDSLKNVSILISGSGSLERRVFLREQHQIIDILLE